MKRLVAIICLALSLLFVGGCTEDDSITSGPFHEFYWIMGSDVDGDGRPDSVEFYLPLKNGHVANPLGGYHWGRYAGKWELQYNVCIQSGRPENECLKEFNPYLPAVSRLLSAMEGDYLVMSTHIPKGFNVNRLWGYEGAFVSYEGIFARYNEKDGASYKLGYEVQLVQLESGEWTFVPVGAPPNPPLRPYLCED